MQVRSSIGTGHQPLKLKRRVRFPHGPLLTTRRVAELVDARASEARAPEAWEFESPPGDFGNPFPRRAGARPGLMRPIAPGSIPGPGTRGWAGARPSFIRSEAEVRLPDPQLSVFTNGRSDTWINPAGQLEVLRAAAPVYRLLGAGDFTAKELPPDGRVLSAECSDTLSGPAATPSFARIGKPSSISRTSILAHRPARRWRAIMTPLSFRS